MKATSTGASLIRAHHHVTHCLESQGVSPFDAGLFASSLQHEGAVWATRSPKYIRRAYETWKAKADALWHRVLILQASHEAEL